MKWSTLLLSLTLYWKEVATSEVCHTPLGRLSTCVTVAECEEVHQAILNHHFSSNFRMFLRQSLCGFYYQYPKVCCGPVPSHYEPPANELYRTPIIPAEIDPVVEEDSYLTPRGNCGKNTNGLLSYRIVGGNTTDLDEFPWNALLGYHKSQNSSLLVYECGGALINNRYVLTAAHCVTGYRVNMVGGLRSVRLGEYDTRSEIDCLFGACADPVQEILVHSTYSHQNYSIRHKTNDIALVRLAMRAKFTIFVQPICLVENNLPLEVGSEFYVAGWGKINYESKTMSPVKLKVVLPIFNKTECDAKYLRSPSSVLRDRIRMTKKHICAGGEAGKDSCTGDSGGPLMRRSSSGEWESVGMVSFGYKCGKEGWPGVYVSVPSYIDWIQDTLRYTNNILVGRSLS